MRPFLVAMIMLSMCLHLGSAEAQDTDADPQSQAKSLWQAYLLSLGSTALPLAINAMSEAIVTEGSSSEAAFGILGLAGMTLGPSAGHWYAGETFTTGLVLRGTSAASVLGLAIYDPHLGHVGTVIGLVAAVALWETGVIWDLATLPGAVRRHNRKVSWQLTPMVTANDSVAGLVLGGVY